MVLVGCHIDARALLLQATNASNDLERMLSPEDLGLTALKETDIYGGKTVEESAKIFVNVLKGAASPEQEAVVRANAGLAISIAENISTEEGLQRASESLASGKALKTFKDLLALNR